MIILSLLLPLLYAVPVNQRLEKRMNLPNNDNEPSESRQDDSDSDFSFGIDMPRDNDVRLQPRIGLNPFNNNAPPRNLAIGPAPRLPLLNNEEPSPFVPIQEQPSPNQVPSVEYLGISEQENVPRMPMLGDDDSPGEGPRVRRRLGSNPFDSPFTNSGSDPNQQQQQFETPLNNPLAQGRNDLVDNDNERITSIIGVVGQHLSSNQPIYNSPEPSRPSSYPGLNQQLPTSTTSRVASTSSLPTSTGYPGPETPNQGQGQNRPYPLFGRPPSQPLITEEDMLDGNEAPAFNRAEFYRQFPQSQLPGFGQRAFDGYPSPTARLQRQATIAGTNPNANLSGSRNPFRRRPRANRESNPQQNEGMTNHPLLVPNPPRTPNTPRNQQLSSRLPIWRNRGQAPRATTTNPPVPGNTPAPNSPARSQASSTGLDNANQDVTERDSPEPENPASFNSPVAGSFNSPLPQSAALRSPASNRPIAEPPIFSPQNSNHRRRVANLSMILGDILQDIDNDSISESSI